VSDASRRTRGWLFVALLPLISAAPLRAYTVVAVTSANQLIQFDTSTPGTTSAPIAITGLGSGESILGIDFRPATGQLYGLGSGSRIYVINTTTGVATQVGSNGAFTLSGTSFAFDFNPTVDRIRVVSDTDQNLRLNPNNGALAATDVAINPAGFTVTAAAYTSNFAGTTSTTLYTIDVEGDRLAIQSPPNDGTQNPIGPLGVNALSPAAFDFVSPAPAGFNFPFAVLTLNGTSSSLYSVNVTTGAVTLIGAIGALPTLVTGMAIVQPPSVSFSSGTYSVSESGTVATITINRFGSTEGTTTVGFATADGSATAPADYADSDQIVTFAPGVSTQTVTIPLVNDGVFEGDETVNLSLSNPTGGAFLGTFSLATLTIVDDEVQPTISISDVTVSESAGTATFTVTLSGASASTVTVSAQTANGSASGGVDFTSTGPTTLTFVPLDVSETFTVPITSDILLEGPEFFLVNLSSPSNATIADGQGVGTITDDDAAPQVPVLSGPMLFAFTILLAAAGAALLGRRLKT